MILFEKDERLLFSNFEFNRAPNGWCRARVELARRSGERYVGEQEGSGSLTLSLRYAAQASVAALQQVVDGGPAFELLGIKTVSAFDSTVVIVSVGVRFDGRRVRLVGSYVTEEGPERAAAIAVLNATNRYLGSDLFLRS